ncbi:protein of unknown function [Micropruina glycogenica]|uniref:Uncharacterized protein n=1 Tax=Micropruina glycogenica TaxID=75385 RepID=A0A2N9JJZ8_9ACTN|nr:protein of unknown function [Micropruina glycogenica]
MLLGGGAERARRGGHPGGQLDDEQAALDRAFAGRRGRRTAATGGPVPQPAGRPQLLIGTAVRAIVVSGLRRARQ